jgi:hypothetical protein
LDKVRETPPERALPLRDTFIAVSENPRQPAPVGADRAEEIAINILLPFCYARGRYGSDENLAAKADRLFVAFPGSPANGLEKHTARQMGLKNAEVNSALRRQGLLHIYRTLCIQGKCGECDAGRVC